MAFDGKIFFINSNHSKQNFYGFIDCLFRAVVFDGATLFCSLSIQLAALLIS